MKFTVNDKTYFVKWQYTNGLSPTMTQTNVTVCKIYDNSSSYETPLIEESCSCYITDRFNKNTGRKISLDRALKQLFPGSNKGLNQKARAIAWQEYFKESPKRLK